MKESAVKFKGGNGEGTVRHVHTFWLVEHKKGYRQDYNVARDAKVVQIAAKAIISDDVSDSEMQKDKYDSKIKECKSAMKDARGDL